MNAIFRAERDTSAKRETRGRENGVEVRVMHSRSDAPSSTPTHSVLNFFFP